LMVNCRRVIREPVTSCMIANATAALVSHALAAPYGCPSDRGSVLAVRG
jgi:hypothetical protein